MPNPGTHGCQLSPVVDQHDPGCVTDADNPIGKRECRGVPRIPRVSKYGVCVGVLDSSSSSMCSCCSLSEVSRRLVDDSW